MSETDLRDMLLAGIEGRANAYTEASDPKRVLADLRAVVAALRRAYGEIDRLSNPPP